MEYHCAMEEVYREIPESFRGFYLFFAGIFLVAGLITLRKKRLQGLGLIVIALSYLGFSMLDWNPAIVSIASFILMAGYFALSAWAEPTWSFKTKVWSTALSIAVTIGMCSFLVKEGHFDAHEISIRSDSIRHQYRNGLIEIIAKPGMSLTVLRYKNPADRRWVLRSKGPDIVQARWGAKDQFETQRGIRVDGDELGRRIAKWGGVEVLEKDLPNPS